MTGTPLSGQTGSSLRQNTLQPGREIASAQKARLAPSVPQELDSAGPCPTMRLWTARLNTKTVMFPSLPGQSGPIAWHHVTVTWASRTGRVYYNMHTSTPFFKADDECEICLYFVLICWKERERVHHWSNLKTTIHSLCSLSRTYWQNMQQSWFWVFF